MLLAGTAKLNVSRIFRCSWNTVSSLWNRYQQTGSTSDQPRSVRPRVTTRAEDTHSRLRHLRDRRHITTSTARTLFRGRITAQPVRSRLRSVNLRPRRPYRGPMLRCNNRDLRLNWTRAHFRWNQRQWNSVIFSDESRFNLSFADGRARVYRRTRESTLIVVSQRETGLAEEVSW